MRWSAFPTLRHTPFLWPKVDRKSFFLMGSPRGQRVPLSWSVVYGFLPMVTTGCTRWLRIYLSLAGGCV
ncbi:hypothetical protein JTE90_016971 [Oedothorax gibbosus]|uniref:Uncharacterized protein n=1 Tax=Oedothorax gibbosus TaxID=931172 RepID=A0AAV6UHC1_9ARAC|nr:hypothetical protein JTE90_016971 [Oedothorax gibbosus]